MMVGWRLCFTFKALIFNSHCHEKVSFYIRFNHFGSSLFAQLKVQNLVTEHLVNPVGIGVAQPRFGWQLSSDKKV